MKAFIIENAIKSTVANKIIGAVIPSLVLLSDSAVQVKRSTPNLRGAFRSSSSMDQGRVVR